MNDIQSYLDALASLMPDADLSVSPVKGTYSLKIPGTDFYVNSDREITVSTGQITKTLKDVTAAREKEYAAGAIARAADQIVVGLRKILDDAGYANISEPVLLLLLLEYGGAVELGLLTPQLRVLLNNALKPNNLTNLYAE